MIGKYADKAPLIGPRAWVAEDARVIGDVEMGEDASVWYQSVVRGDVCPIRIGARSNIQDHCTLHVTADTCPTIIHDDVTLGHRVVIHGAEVRSGALVGIGSIVLDRAVIEEGALVAAMSLVTPGTIVPAGMMVAGQPARVVREVRDSEREWMRATITNYVEYARRHRESGG